MKGLILKDFYLIRFQLIITSIGALMIAYMCYSFAPDTGLTSAMGDVGRIMIPAMFDYIIIVIGSSFFINTISEDFISGWIKQQRTLPIANRQAVGAKLIATYILIGGLALFSLAFNLLFWFSYGGTLEIMIAIPLCVGLIQVIALSPVFPLGQRYGLKTANTVYLLGEILLAVAAMFSMFPALSGDIPIITMRIVFYGALPILAGAVAAVSFFCGSKLYSNDV